MTMERFEDRVCGAELEKDKAAARFDFDGKTYEFCSQKCRDDFSRSPGSYVDESWMDDE
jgi:P-type Cu+ transporter